MNTRRFARNLVLDLCGRSICKVRMAAVLSDSHGIFGWAWNHAGRDGSGTHAEEELLRFKKINRARMRGATLTVAGYRGKAKNPVLSRPCEVFCLPLAQKCGIRIIEYLSKDGHWVTEHLVGEVLPTKLQKRQRRTAAN